MVKRKKNDRQFFVGLDRIMVSLGALPDGRRCPYCCAFCYNAEGFSWYPSLSVPEILECVKRCDAKYDIIYVSGDTDSFAPPRANTGIRLLEGLADLGRDVLFTTRTTFAGKDIRALGAIARKIARSDHLLFGCISIPRLRSGQHLESAITPRPRERIATLKALKEEGLQAVLTLRPFLPIIPPQEYIEIVDLCKGFTDLVLGECWYADRAGHIERRVFRGPTPADVKFVLKRMDFDRNRRLWKVWEGREIERMLRKHCRGLGLPFHMRSQPAIQDVRNRISARVRAGLPGDGGNGIASDRPLQDQ